MKQFRWGRLHRGKGLGESVDPSPPLPPIKFRAKQQIAFHTITMEACSHRTVVYFPWKFRSKICRGWVQIETLESREESPQPPTPLSFPDMKPSQNHSAHILLPLWSKEQPTTAIPGQECPPHCSLGLGTQLSWRKQKVKPGRQSDSRYLASVSRFDMKQS